MPTKNLSKAKDSLKPEDIAISVKNVSKSFKLPHEKQNSVKGAFINMFRGKKTYERQQALKDISFDIKKGEFFGVVGRNGSGKSTLLKLISGIYAPDKGSITVNGKLVPFIELGVGFNPELSGRENVFLNGALLGFSRDEMDKMYDEIVEFAELERFMDQKLKNYSSGMQVRLAFSIAIRAKADILVLDEVLAVGDEAFQRKCNEFFQIIKKDKNKTIILVTHSMESVTEYCDKAILIEDGVIKEDGEDVFLVANSYSKQFVVKTETSNDSADRFGSGELTIENVSHEVTDEEIAIELDIINHTNKTYEGVFIGVNFRYEDKVVAGNHMRYVEANRKGLVINKSEVKSIKLVFDNILTSFDYTIDLSLRTEGGVVNFDTRHGVDRIQLAKAGSSKYYKVLIPMIAEESDK